MIDSIIAADELAESQADEDREEEKPADFEELLARFVAKMNSIPRECHTAMGWLYVYRKIQDERKRQANRANQLVEGKRVFWSHVLPVEMVRPMAALITQTIEPLKDAEEAAALNLHRAMRHASWYREVAIPAARGIGISEGAGTLSAAKILWAFGAASRFSIFGAIVRYSRLAPENGKVPGRVRGKRIHYNPGAWQALFDLSESWNRMPDCEWRLLWDAHKIRLAREHASYPKGRIHNMARRKVLREFLRDLYDTWVGWEARQSM